LARVLRALSNGRIQCGLVCLGFLVLEVRYGAVISVTSWRNALARQLIFEIFLTLLPLRIEKALLLLIDRIGRILV
jgi:hypothetical protein